MNNEHIAQTRLAVVALAYEVEITLRLLEQLPDAEQFPAPVAGLLEDREQQVHEAIAALQGRLAGALNLARMQVEVGGHDAR